MSQGKTLIIAGGGTGGHIYPALAIARAAQRLRPDLPIHFVGSAQGLEVKIIPKENFPLHLIPIGKLNRNVGLWTQLRTFVGLPWSFITSLFLIRRLKPAAVVGVGGYASAPVLFVASLLGIPTFIWEPNAYPGLANRWLSWLAREAIVVFKEARPLLRTRRVQVLGMPVRADIEDVGQRRASHAQEFHLLIFGGSQGARGLNNVLIESLKQGGSWLEDTKIVLQTGAQDFARIREEFEKLPEVRRSQVDVREFLYDMPERYQWADLVICRSGIGTIAELAAVAQPALLVPFPFAADNHQQKNAEVLVRADAAAMILQKDLTPERFQNFIQDVKNNRVLLQEWSENVKKFHQPQAAVAIAQHILKQVEV